MQVHLVSAFSKGAGTYGIPWAAACGGWGADPRDGFGRWLRELEQSWCTTDSALQFLTALKP